MSRIVEEVLEANERYAVNFGDKGALAIPPSQRFAIITCMDARLDPAQFAGLNEGDAHVIPAGIPVHGYIYDVEVGRLIEVSEATAADKTT